MDSEYKYGDLLQSINRSHHDIQSQLIQGGLSPITPADASAAKPWAGQNISVPISTYATSVTSVPLLQLGSGTSISSREVISAPNISLSQAPILSEALAGRIGNMAPNVRTSLSATGPQASYPQPTGFTPVVLPTSSSKSKNQYQAPNTQVQNSFINISRSLEQVAVTYASQVNTKAEQRYPDKEVSVTQPGPPNVTISTCTSIPSQEKPVQKLPRNPFTFPATPPVSLTNERPVVSTNKPGLVFSDGLKEKQRHSSDEMPQLSPVSKEKRELKEETSEDDLVPLVSITSVILFIFSNFFY